MCMHFFIEYDTLSSVSSVAWSVGCCSMPVAAGNDKMPTYAAYYAAL